MFRGEKTTTFWVGLVALGYSIFQFFQAFWIPIYISGILPNALTYTASFNLNLFRYGLEEYLPNIVAGIIFLIIGLYIMKVGVKKQPISNPEVNKTP